jgi:pSer/pThr/pTyr-binding forkhead associated (FHA) protein
MVRMGSRVRVPLRALSEVYLAVVEGPDAGREARVSNELVVGRGEAAELVLSDPSVSRQHALIRADGATAVVEDLGSSNGTYVNGEAIAAPRRVGGGDVVGLGASALQVRIGPTEAQPLPGEETELLTPPDSQATRS